MVIQTKFFYFDSQYAIQIHDWIIRNSGGREGVHDLNSLESPLEHIKNDDYYPIFISKLTHLVYSVNKNHAFNDGNKRSSIALGAFFLEINGYDFISKKFIKEMENIAVWVADNLISKEMLQNLLYSIVYEDDYSESLKLELIALGEGNI